MLIVFATVLLIGSYCSTSIEAVPNTGVLVNPDSYSTADGPELLHHLSEVWHNSMNELALEAMLTEGIIDHSEMDTAAGDPEAAALLVETGRQRGYTGTPSPLAAAEATSDGFPLPPPGQKVGLSANCANKICLMMEYIVSCKAIGLGMSKICAQYFFGYAYECSVFPSPDDILDAPSVCIPQFLGLLGQLTSGAIKQYLFGSFDETACDRTCYQHYQNTSIDFYGDCFLDIANNSTLQTIYPLAYALGFFQEFRNQNCGMNAKGENCYTNIAELLNSTVSAGGASGGLSFDCNFANQSDVYYDRVLAFKNNLAFQQLCESFGEMQCCAATGITLLSQAQAAAIGGADPTLFPPCLLQYLDLYCPTVDMTLLCTNGSMTNQSIMTGQLTIPRVENAQQQLPFPNMYNQTDVLGMQIVVTTVLQNYLGFAVQPWLFMATYPFQVEIIGYDYLNASGASLTPQNGSMYWPPEGDYVAATSGIFTYQIVVQNNNDSQAQELFAALSNPLLGTDVANAYTGNSSNQTSAVGLASPITYEPEPLNVGAAARMDRAFFGFVGRRAKLLSVVVCAVATTAAIGVTSMGVI